MLYWIWKNAGQDIVGLEHYRRHFLLQDDWYHKMKDSHVDVILPTPLYVAPSLAQNYRDRHAPADWDFMMDHLQLICPGDYKEAVSFFDNNLYSPCNMFIMKKEVLDELNRPHYIDTGRSRDIVKLVITPAPLRIIERQKTIPQFHVQPGCNRNLLAVYNDPVLLCREFESRRDRWNEIFT